VVSVVGEAVKFEVQQLTGSQAGAAKNSDSAACGDVVEFVNGGHQVAELRGLAGWAVAVDRRWVVQLSLRGGYGLSRLQLGVEDGSDVDQSCSGWSLEPNAEVLWAFSERARLSLGGGWRTSHYAYAGNGLDIDLVNDGPTVRIGIEWQLSVAPQRLR
jgi:hypothetical protein